MLKDIILAIILGTLLGFGLTGGYFAVKKSSSVSTNPPQIVAPTVQVTSSTPTPAILTTQSNQITIISPQNQSIVANSKITVKGSTAPNSYLIITTQTKSYYSQSDPAGNFAVDIEIDSGANLISLNSFDSQDIQATSTLLVTYSTAKI
ncbi:MAG: hypothetical protein NTY75_00735 [Candidatus Shapirobacteria bacterium]|nr:hypothetical protein [Candidatus Shapirobacteria bacterium]